MDTNIKALLHVQSSLLLALCATHQDAPLLLDSFELHLRQSQDAVVKSPEMTAMVGAWAQTFRLRLQRPVANPTG